MTSLRFPQSFLAKRDKPHVVTIGNVVDGYAFFGPFDSYDDALEWADMEFGDSTADDWRVAELQPIENAVTI